MTLSDESRNIRRWRALWGGLIWVLLGVLVIFGAGYAFGGRNATPTQGAFAVLIRYVPGDLHTYGAVMLVLAALLLHGLLPGRGVVLDDRWLVRVLYIVGGFSFLIVWLFAWSWVLSGTQTWSAMGYWGGECVTALLCARLSPPRPTPPTAPERRASAQ